MSSPSPTEGGGGGAALASRFPTRIHRLTLPGTAVAGGAPRVLDLLAPVNPDVLLDDPIVEQRYQADNYMPYWPIVWPSGLMLAARILTDQSSPPALPPEPGCPPHEKQEAKIENQKCIDLGCGLGTAGIAAGLRGWHVTFTDYDPEAVEFAAYNARHNGVPPQRIRALHMDWRAPIPERFPWVLASDVLYERRLHPLLLDAVEKLLAPGGAAWVSDPQRTSAENFPLAAVERGFKVASINMEGESFAGGKQTGQLYILTRV
jgi:2-polyprenyl-3-methyl-5-hydroxy-6-metoxy-1,4-benzoquinol methylase